MYICVYMSMYIYLYIYIYIHCCLSLRLGPTRGSRAGHWMRIERFVSAIRRHGRHVLLLLVTSSLCLDWIPSAHLTAIWHMVMSSDFSH